MIFRKWFGRDKPFRPRSKGHADAAEMWNAMAEGMLAKQAKQATQAMLEQAICYGVAFEYAGFDAILGPGSGQEIFGSGLSYETLYGLNKPEPPRVIRGFHAYDGAAMCAVVKK